MYCDYKISQIISDRNTQVTARFYEGDYEQRQNPITGEDESVYARSAIIDEAIFWIEGVVDNSVINTVLRKHLESIKGARNVTPELS